MVETTQETRPSEAEAEAALEAATKAARAKLSAALRLEPGSPMLSYEAVERTLRFERVE